MARPAGVRARLLVVVLAAVLPVVALVVAQASAQRDREAEHASEHALRVARLLADRQDEFADELGALLRSLMAAGGDAGFRPTCSALDGVLEARQIYDAVTLVQTGSGDTCGSRELDVPDLAPGEEVRRYALDGAAALVVAVGGDGIAAAGRMPLGFGTAPDRSELPAGSAFVLFDAEGRIYARVPDGDRFEGSVADLPVADGVDLATDGTVEAEGVDGRRRLYGLVPVPDSDPPLVVAVGTPTSAAYAAADADLRRTLLAVGVTALLAVLATLLLAEVTVTRPLRAIATVARRLAQGDLEARTNRPAGDEIGDVGTALDDLAAAVATSNEALAKAAREREALLLDLVGVHDQERRRLAEDIHDETIQALTAAGLRVQRLRRKVDDPELQELAAGAELAVGRAIADLRGLMVALLPEDPTSGLAPLLRRVLADELDGQGVAWDIDVDVPMEPSAAVSSLVARNAREAVRNAARHAGAEMVTLRARVSGGAIEVSVIDDGRGFDPAEPVPDDHLGLRSMQQRMERVGGWWRVDSAPGEGTAVRFGLPIA